MSRVAPSLPQRRPAHHGSGSFFCFSHARIAVIFPLLPGDNVTCKFVIVVVLAELENDLRHVDRTLVMRDHAEHEGSIGIWIGNAFHHRSMHAVHGCAICGRCSVRCICRPVTGMRTVRIFAIRGMRRPVVSRRVDASTLPIEHQVQPPVADDKHDEGGGQPAGDPDQ